MSWDESETEPDPETGNGTETERLMKRYRPAGPPDGLRARVLSAAAPCESGWATAGWAAAAAAVMLSVALNAAAGQLQRDAVRDVGWPPLKWTPAAEELAHMLDSGAIGRAYLSLTLAAGQGQFAGGPNGLSPFGSPGGSP